MIAGEPVPVQSCWNGVVAFDAAPFAEAQSPLLFRGVSDDLAKYHLEASECCLVHVDNPLTSTHGVWLNPQVRVGYSPEAYAAVHPVDAGADWPPSALATATGVWKARVMAWLTTPYVKSTRVQQRLRRWATEGVAAATAPEGTRHEAGSMCLINEMQVLAENGWAHV